MQQKVYKLEMDSDSQELLTSDNGRVIIEWYLYNTTFLLPTYLATFAHKVCKPLTFSTLLLNNII